MYLLEIKVSENGGRGMTKKEREAHFISYINPNNSHSDNSLEYITKCSNCGCGLSNVAFYCPICGVKINERVVHARDNSIIIYPSWIPVSERLPEENISVIGTTKYDDIYETELYDDCGEKKWYADGCYDVPIVAWMPLPEPYRESEDKE